MKLFNDEKFILITHYDLDGAGCFLLINNFFHEQISNVIPCGYDKLKDTIIKNSSQHDNILFSDISLDQKLVDLINKNYKNVVWFDHHETSMNLEYPEHWKTFLNTKMCGTKLIYFWLKHNGYNIEPMKKFVQRVNDWDIWIHEFPDSRKLNNIFWELKFWDFVKSFRNFNWKKELWNTAKEIEKEQKEIISGYDTYLIDGFLRIVIGDKHLSSIPFYFDETDIIIIRNGTTLSVRSKHDLTDLYKLIEKNNVVSVGGHKNAGGINLTDENEQMDIIEIIYEYLKKMVDK